METLEAKIIKILTKNPGLRARTIAPLLGIDRSDVNRTLYGSLRNEVYQDSNWGWHIQGNKKKPQYSKKSKIVAPIKTIHSIIDIMFEEDEDIFAMVNVSNEMLEKTIKYHIDYSILCFYFDLVLDETEYEYIIEEEYEAFIHEFGNLLSPYLKFSLFEDIFKGFFTRQNEVPMALFYATNFDFKYQTCYAHLLVRCFELLGEGITETEHIEFENETTYIDHIYSLQSYVNRQTYVEKAICVECGKVMLEDKALEDEEEKYCESCFSIKVTSEDDDSDFDEEDDSDEDEEADEDEFDDVDDSDSSNDETDLNDNADENDDSDDEKKEIVEDCRTCKHKKAFPVAWKNRLCSSYVYSK